MGPEGLECYATGRLEPGSHCPKQKEAPMQLIAMPGFFFFFFPFSQGSSFGCLRVAGNTGGDWGYKRMKLTGVGWCRLVLASDLNMRSLPKVEFVFS